MKRTSHIAALMTALLMSAGAMAQTAGASASSSTDPSRSTSNTEAKSGVNATNGVSAATQFNTQVDKSGMNTRAEVKAGAAQNPSTGDRQIESPKVPAVGAVNQRTKAEVRAGAAQNPATSDNKQIESPKIPGVGR